MNDMISMGVAGFRIDAVKHMWPNNLNAIVSALDDLSTEKGFPAEMRPFIAQEVIDQGGNVANSLLNCFFINAIMIFQTKNVH